MASEPITAATTTIAPMINPVDIMDSQDGCSTQHRGQSWWRVGASATDRSLTTEERNAAVAASPHGQRCVIAGYRTAVEIYHLLPKSMTGKEVQDLQYSFGRKLNLNSRWLLLHVVLHLHHKFDNDTHGWALIPELLMITNIADKMRAETERRLQLGITGPWPDYRQPGWFPITTAGFVFQLIPLGLANPAGDSIHRFMDMDDPNASPRNIRQFDPPSFEGFPILNLHVHPYAVIMNAYPKLEKHLQTQELPPPANTNFDDLKFIYDTLTKSVQQSQPSAAFSTQQQKPLHRLNAPTRANSPETCCPLRSHPSTQSTHSHLGSAERDTYDDSLDNLDNNLDGPQDDLEMISHDWLSDSVPDALMPKDANGTSWTLQHWFMVLKQKGVMEWIAGVEHAHGQNVPAEPKDDPSSESTKYTAEPARAPPTLD